MRTIATMIVGMVVLFPCLLIFNESGNILPNLAGFIYIAILYIIGRTKVGKKAIYEVIRANKKIEDYITKTN